MSDIKARYVGPSLDGVHLTVPVSTEGEPPRHVHVAHGGELPTDVDGHAVPASFRNSLLDQVDNWTKVQRSSGSAKSAAKPAASESTTAAKTAEKEG